MNHMTPQQKTTITHAAALLSREAECIRESHTLPGGDWDLTEPEDQSAKDAHDELTDAARDLLAMVA